MLKIILLNSFLFLSSGITVESIYSFSVNKIEGGNKQLSGYEGKKIMIITLPLQQNAAADSVLRSLDTLSNIYAASLVIIGTPAIEDGYTNSMKNSLRQWYRSILNPGIIVTEGLYTRKTSGNQQHPLFKWLTDKNRNEHFDKDIDGPENKFIVWQDGELTGVFGKSTRLWGNTLKYLLQGE